MITIAWTCKQSTLRYFVSLV